MDFSTTYRRFALLLHFETIGTLIIYGLVLSIATFILFPIYCGLMYIIAAGMSNEIYSYLVNTSDLEPRNGGGANTVSPLDNFLSYTIFPAILIILVTVCVIIRSTYNEFRYRIAHRDRESAIFLLNNPGTMFDPLKPSLVKLEESEVEFVNQTNQKYGGPNDYDIEKLSTTMPSAASGTIVRRVGNAQSLVYEKAVFLGLAFNDTILLTPNKAEYLIIHEMMHFRYHDEWLIPRVETFHYLFKEFMKGIFKLGVTALVGIPLLSTFTVPFIDPNALSGSAVLTLFILLLFVFFATALPASLIYVFTCNCLRFVRSMIELRTDVAAVGMYRNPSIIRECYGHSANALGRFKLKSLFDCDSPRFSPKEIHRFVINPQTSLVPKMRHLILSLMLAVLFVAFFWKAAAAYYVAVLFFLTLNFSSYLSVIASLTSPLNTFKRNDYLYIALCLTCSYYLLALARVIRVVLSSEGESALKLALVYTFRLSGIFGLAIALSLMLAVLVIVRRYVNFGELRFDNIVGGYVLATVGVIWFVSAVGDGEELINLIHWFPFSNPMEYAESAFLPGLAAGLLLMFGVLIGVTQNSILGRFWPAKV